MPSDRVRHHGGEDTDTRHQYGIAHSGRLALMRRSAGEGVTQGMAAPMNGISASEKREKENAFSQELESHCRALGHQSNTAARGIAVLYCSLDTELALRRHWLTI